MYNLKTRNGREKIEFTVFLGLDTVAFLISFLITVVIFRCFCNVFCCFVFCLRFLFFKGSKSVLEFLGGP